MIAAGLAAALAAAACETDILTGGAPEPGMPYALSVRVTNVGSGFGRVAVSFPAGTVEDGCTGVLQPGQSCTATSRRPFPIRTATLRATAEPGSSFPGWDAGRCVQIEDEDCTVEDTSHDRDPLIPVDVRFVLDAAPGG